MARITVEDCLKQIGNENRFALIHLAVTRVKQLRNGAPLLLESCKNKEIVCVLREIAKGAVTLTNVRELGEGKKRSGETLTSEGEEQLSLAPKTVLETSAK